jgi:hypothetical protein
MNLLLSMAMVFMLLATAFAHAPAWAIGLAPVWVLMLVFLNVTRFITFVV